MDDVATLEAEPPRTVETSMAKSVGMGALGALALGGWGGFLLGGVVGGMDAVMEFTVVFHDGRWVTAETSPDHWNKFVEARRVADREARREAHRVPDGRPIKALPPSTTSRPPERPGFDALGKPTAD